MSRDGNRGLSRKAKVKRQKAEVKRQKATTFAEAMVVEERQKAKYSDM
jgi:hypothetical protein